MQAVRGRTGPRSLESRVAYGGEVCLAIRRRRGVRPWLLGVLGLVTVSIPLFLLWPDHGVGSAIVVILTPLQNAVVSEGPTTVSVNILNARWIAKSEREGVHLHYYLDVEPPTTPNRRAVTRLGSWASSSEASFVWNVLGAGTHRLSVQLVRGDDTPFVPPVLAAVSVIIPPAASQRSVSPTTPRSAPPPGGGC